MARYRVRGCGCEDWPACEHADNFALTGEDAADCCCPVCGDPECFGECDGEYFEPGGVVFFGSDDNTPLGNIDTPLSDLYGGE
jgi:hypothetical protein